LPAVSVVLLGARPGGLTDSSGFARIRRLTCEKHEFLARAVGYKSERISVELVSGGRDTVKFRMRPGSDSWRPWIKKLTAPARATVADTIASAP